jgi:hypothetical protein
MPEAVQTASPSSSSQSPPPSGAPAAQPGASSTPAPSPSPETQATPAPATRPEWTVGLPDKFWDAGKNEVKGADLRTEIDRLRASEAAETSRKASVPPADSYKLEFAKDYQLPAGTQWTWDTADPTLVTAARQFANEAGLSQDGFSKLLGIYAASRIGEDQRFATAKQAEIGKLGVNAPTRVDAVNTWLEAQLGTDLSGALRQGMLTAKSIEAYESLMRRFTSQGVSGNPAAGRDGAPREPARLSDADYAKMTFAEKTQYAQQFDQSRFNGRGP